MNEGRLNEILNTIDTNKNNIVDKCEDQRYFNLVVGDKESIFYDERYKLFCNAKIVAQNTYEKELQEEEEKLNEKKEIKAKNQQKLKEIQMGNQKQFSISLDSSTILGISIVCITVIIITALILFFKKKK